MMDIQRNGQACSGAEGRPLIRCAFILDDCIEPEDGELYCCK